MGIALVESPTQVPRVLSRCQTRTSDWEDPSEPHLGNVSLCEICQVFFKGKTK